MEVVSAAASITGILGFTGQAISGILQLRSLFQGCSGASKSISKWLNDLNLLIQTLEEVRDLISKLKDLPDSGSDALLASLQIQVEDCSKDVAGWVSKAAKDHPDFSQGTKRAFKKLLVAINKEDKVEAYMVLGRHREGIATKLTLIGRSLDIQHALGLKDLQTKVDQGNTATEETGKVTQEALQNLQTTLQDDLAGHNSVRGSIASFNSSLVRIESLLGSIAGSASFSGSVVGSIASRRSSRSYRRPLRRRPAGQMTRKNKKDKSSKADMFEAKVATAIGASGYSSSDSDDAFVYPDNPAGPSNSKGHTHHIGRWGRRPHDLLFDDEMTFPNVTKRTMKFANSHTTSANEINRSGRRRPVRIIAATGELRSSIRRLESESLRSQAPTLLGTFKARLASYFRSDRSISKPSQTHHVQASHASTDFSRTPTVKARLSKIPLGSAVETPAITLFAGGLLSVFQCPDCKMDFVKRKVYERHRSLECVFRSTQFRNVLLQKLTTARTTNFESLVTITVQLEERNALKSGMLAHVLTRDGLGSGRSWRVYGDSMRETGPDMARLETAVVLAKHESTLLENSYVKQPSKILLQDVSQSIGGEDADDALNTYLRLVCEEGVAQCRALMDNQISWCLQPGTRNDQPLVEFGTTSIVASTPPAVSLQLQIKNARQKCWEQGYNLDEIDRMLNKCFPHLSEALQNLTTDEADNEEETQTTEETAPRDWTSKLDRINLWLWETMRSSEDQANVHKTALAQNGTELEGEDEWARVVLKHWFLDEAAVGRSGIASTNGAVDSEGLKHDVRVDLGFEDDLGGVEEVRP